MGMAAGDHDAGGRAAAVAVGDARGGDDVVVEVGIEGGEGKEVVVGAAAAGGDGRLAQRLADIDVLPRDAVLTDGALDEVLELVGAEQVGVAQAPVAAVGPGELDLALVAAVEFAAEQMLQMTQHLPGVRLDDRVDVVAHDWLVCRWPGPCRDQNSARARSWAGAACGGGTWAACGRAVAGVPCQTSDGSTGLASGSSAGRSTHFTSSSIGL
jgi:hypothetical protein